jgi:hypothetical protein
MKLFVLFINKNLTCKNNKLTLLKKLLISHQPFFDLFNTNNYIMEAKCFIN